MSSPVLNNLSKYLLADGFDFNLDLVNSQGSYIVNKDNGKKYVDFFTCFASMPLGFNHPKLANDEFKEKIFRAAINKPSISDLYPEEFANFVDTFFTTSVPKQFKYSFFIEGGALANENALKVAFDWKTKKVLQRTGKIVEDLKVIYFNEAFHGRSGYTITLTNTDPVKVKYFPKFEWFKVDNPKLNYPITSQVLEEIIIKEKSVINNVRELIANNYDKIAAIIIEPIQAEGGDNHFRREFLKELRDICTENELLLIFDEVQTGVGLTGKFWYSEKLEIIPDVLTFGKKMQVCGILTTDRIDDIENHVFRESSRINSTWGGNLVDMIRAERYIQIIHEDNLLSNVNEMSLYLKSKLNELFTIFPDVVSNIRGEGLMCAMDLSNDLQKKFVSRCYENGLFILKCGTNSIRFRTQLGINSSEIEEGFEIITKSLKQLI